MVEPTGDYGQDSMKYKNEIRCAADTGILVAPEAKACWSTYRCVLRTKHIGQHLAWDNDWRSVRWSDPKPKQCPINADVRNGIVAIGMFRCLGVEGHTGPCQFENMQGKVALPWG